jgi:hypothetical protein
VANFIRFISECTALQPKFNPVAAALTITGMQQKLADAEQIREKFKKTTEKRDAAINFRRPLFEAVPGLAVRAVGAMEDLGMDAGAIEDAKGYLRKIQGVRSPNSPKPKSKGKQPDEAPNGPDENADLPEGGDNDGLGSKEPRQRSVSQRGMDNLYDNFDNICILLEAHPEYVPNETDLQLAALLAYRALLKQANDAAVNAETDYNNDKARRDEVYYAPHTGLVDVTKRVKRYVRNTFTPQSAEYKRINAIKFRNFRDK